VGWKWLSEVVRARGGGQVSMVVMWWGCRCGHGGCRWWAQEHGGNCG
jgi:hypothetical protein